PGLGLRLSFGRQSPAGQQSHTQQSNKATSRATHSKSPGSERASISNRRWRGNGGVPSNCRSVNRSRLDVDKPPRELQGCRRKNCSKTVLGSEMVEKRPVRRVVTGHDADGKA